LEKPASHLTQTLCSISNFAAWQMCIPKKLEAIPMNRGMSRIKSMNTKPEMLVRKFLHANGFRYKLHDKSLPGKPDIVLPKYSTVIFVYGCFWHGHVWWQSFL